MRLFILLTHDGELVEDVGSISAADAIKLEEQRIQSGQSVATVGFIPHKRCTRIAHIAGGHPYRKYDEVDPASRALASQP